MAAEAAELSEEWSLRDRLLLAIMAKAIEAIRRKPATAGFSSISNCGRRPLELSEEEEVPPPPIE